jgi:hypothetical protein
VIRLYVGTKASRILAALGILSLAGSTACATEYRWTGEKSSNWSDPANWTSKPFATITSSSTTLLPGATLAIDPTLTRSAPTTGDSVVISAGSTVQLVGDVTVANLTMESGSNLGGNGNISVSGTFNLDKAALTGAGTANILSRAVLNLTGGTASTGQARLQKRISNSGTVNLKDGEFLLEADIENNAGATFTVGTSTITAAKADATKPRFLNKGLLVKTGETAELDVALENAGNIRLQSGTLRVSSRLVQRAGSLSLDGGDLSCPQMLDIRGGDLGGTGVINGSVLNDGGTVKPGYSPGTITINGNYTQTAMGILEMEIGGLLAGTQHDQLIVNGSAYCEGTLDMQKYNNFIPKERDTFVLIQSWSLVYDFTEKTGLWPAPQMFYYSNVDSSSNYIAAAYKDADLPNLSVSTPSADTTYTTPTSPPTTITGTAMDPYIDTGLFSSSLASVKNVFYRYPMDGRPAGYWTGGTTWSTSYNSATCEPAATLSSPARWDSWNTNFSWSAPLPALAYGRYWVRSSAFDNSNNVRRIFTYFWKSNGTSPLTLSTKSANAANSTITLTFTGNLDSFSAQDATRYAVKVNNVAASIVNTSYSVGSRTVTLTLNPGRFNVGDAVTVTWDHLFESNGRMLNGPSGTITAQ